MDKSLAVVFSAVVFASAAAAGPMPPGWMPPSSVVQIEFIFDNAVRRTNDLPTAGLRAARRQMIGGGSISLGNLQALADAGDGLAAFRYAKILQERGIADTTGAAAHYYSIAAYTGRAFAVPPLARLLRDEGANYSNSRLTQALNAMTVQAISGNPVAATLLGQLYADGVPFGRDLVLAQTYLGLGEGAGTPPAILQLGVALMSDPADIAAGHIGARAALTQAAASDDLSVRVTAENLLRLIDLPISPQTEVLQ